MRSPRRSSSPATASRSAPGRSATPPWSGWGYRSHNLAGGGRNGDFVYIIDWTTNVRGWAPGAVNPGLDADAAAERLTALVEGLSERWHSATLSLRRARELLAGALDREL